MLNKSLQILLLLLLSVTALAEDRTETYSRAQFQTAAGDLRRAPLGSNAKQNCEVILTWTSESPVVMIELTPAVQALLQEKEQTSMSLLAAFMAGQALAQLRAGKEEGFNVDGGKEVIAVYRAIQAAQPGYINEGAEAMVKADKSGQLAKLLAPPAGAPRPPRP